MRRTLFVLLLSFVSVVGLAFGADHRFTLVIDAGHGGHDTGAMGSFSKEKDINLSVALAFGRYVEANCPDVRVIYTRKTDVFIPLQERANIANRNNADLFISVHTNALPGGKQAYGFETYTLGMHRAKDNLDVAMRENSVISMEKDYKTTYRGFDPNSSESYIMFEFIQGANMEKSVSLARMIQKSVCTSAGRPDKGVHQAGFLVLRETSMPSCLLELGFITTPQEERLLNDKSNVETIAKAVYNGFINYKRKYDDSIVVPYKTESVDPISIPRIVPSDNSAKPSATDGNAAAKSSSKTVRKENVTSKSKETSNSKETVTDTDKPVFKVQFLISNRKLQSGDSRLKGLTEYEYYEDGGSFKYTSLPNSDYNAVYRTLKQIREKFPDAFIIAMKNGKMVNVHDAINEFKASRGKK